MLLGECRTLKCENCMNITGSLLVCCMPFHKLLSLFSKATPASISTQVATAIVLNWSIEFAAVSVVMLILLMELH